MTIQPIENLLLQAFASGLPMDRHSVARWIHTGEIGRRKITAEFVFPVLNQMSRSKLLTRDAAGYYRLTDQGRQILADLTQPANNDIAAADPAGCVRREN